MKSHVIVPPEPGRVVININGQTVEVSALADALVNAGESLRSLLSPAEGTGQPTNHETHAADNENVPGQG